MTGSAIGLGGMPMSIEGRPERSRSIATIHAALDAGITLIDTADAYHVGADEVGHNEILIAEALSSYGGDTTNVLVATKGGHLRPGDGSWTSPTGRSCADPVADLHLGAGRSAIGTVAADAKRPDLLEQACCCTAPVKPREVGEGEGRQVGGAPNFGQLLSRGK